MARKSVYNSPEDIGVNPITAGNGTSDIGGKPDFTNATNLYNTLGPRVTGTVQAYIDEVYAGVQSGKYSVSDAENALNVINQQADLGMTGAYGAAMGVVAVAPKDEVGEEEDTGGSGDDFDL